MTHHTSQDSVTSRVPSLGADPAYEILREVTDALQDTRILAVVSWEGDHWYAQDAGLDARAILTKARDALEQAEEFLADPSLFIGDSAC